MLMFKYFDPKAESPTCHDCNRFSHCNKVKIGHPVDFLCTQKDIKPRPAPVSMNPVMEYQYILRQLWMTKNIFESSIDKMIHDGFYPESLCPPRLEPYSARYTEYLFFIDIIDIFTNFIKRNEKPLVDSVVLMTKVLRTKIILEDSKVYLYTDCKKLAESVEKKAKEYEKYHISFLKVMLEEKNEN